MSEMKSKGNGKDNKKGPPLTREGFLKTLQKVTKPLSKPTSEEKSKTSE